MESNEKEIRNKETILEPETISVLEALWARDHRLAEFKDGDRWTCVCQVCLRARRLAPHMAVKDPKETPPEPLLMSMRL